MLGADRVTNFVIQEIITSTVANYVTEASTVRLLFFSEYEVGISSSRLTFAGSLF